MKKQKGGHIIHVSSVSGHIENHGPSMECQKLLVTGLGLGFGVVAGSLMATATSIAQAPSNLRKEQTSAPSPSNTKQKARIFITGSADGLGHAAATTLLTEGYQVVVHVRSQARLAAVLLLLNRSNPFPDWRPGPATILNTSYAFVSLLIILQKLDDHYQVP
jgi:hypothetical protein